MSGREGRGLPGHAHASTARGLSTGLHPSPAQGRASQGRGLLHPALRSPVLQGPPEGASGFWGMQNAAFPPETVLP